MGTLTNLDKYYKSEIAFVRVGSAYGGNKMLIVRNKNNTAFEFVDGRYHGRDGIPEENEWRRASNDTERRLHVQVRRGFIQKYNVRTTEKPETASRLNKIGIHPNICANATRLFWPPDNEYIGCVLRFPVTPKRAKKVLNSKASLFG